MVLKQMSASVCVLEVHNDQEGSGTKSEAQLRGAQLQLASGKGGTYWMDSRDLGHRNQSRFKDLSDWTQEIRRHQFSLILTISLWSTLMVLAWQLFSLRLLHRQGVQAALGF